MTTTKIRLPFWMRLFQSRKYALMNTALKAIEYSLPLMVNDCAPLYVSEGISFDQVMSVDDYKTIEEGLDKILEKHDLFCSYFSCARLTQAGKMIPMTKYSIEKLSTVGEHPPGPSAWLSVKPEYLEEVQKMFEADQKQQED